MSAGMNKLTIFILSSLMLVSCAGGSGHETAGLITETVNTAPTRPYSNLMFPIPVEKLAERADHVLYGDVKAVSGAVESIAPEISMPVSTVTLSVREALKGDASGSFTFKSLGAEIDGSPYYSEDMARFDAGETVVVFLKDFGGTVLPVGHVQGKVVVRGKDDMNEIKDKITYEK